ncbi:hypothetical protein BTS2_2569 [Bacillus sp. TS-2]|nr:hypothetical protein BTS2_2569 [Bacillus sp. TS-2]
MSIVHTLLKQAQSFYKDLENPLPKEDEQRAAYLLMIEQKLNERQNLLLSLEGYQLKEEERNEAEQLVIFNKKIESRMQEIKSTIQLDIGQVVHKKKNARKYENPYSARTPDGIFFDKRE